MDSLIPLASGCQAVSVAAAGSQEFNPGKLQVAQRGSGAATPP